MGRVLGQQRFTPALSCPFSEGGLLGPFLRRGRIPQTTPALTPLPCFTRPIQLRITGLSSRLEGALGDSERVAMALLQQVGGCPVRWAYQSLFMPSSSRIQ